MFHFKIFYSDKDPQEVEILFDKNLHLMSIFAQLLDGVFVEIEMGRMPHVH